MSVEWNFENESVCTNSTTMAEIEIYSNESMHIKIYVAQHEN